MKKKEFKCTFVDKEKKNGWFFGPSYYLTFKIPTLKRTTHRLKVNADQYYDCEIGGNGVVHMYSDNEDSWYFSSEEAEFANENL